MPSQAEAMETDYPIKKDPCLLHYVPFQKNTSHKATLFSRPNFGANYGQGLTRYLKAVGQVRSGKFELSASLGLQRQPSRKSGAVAFFAVIPTKPTLCGPSEGERVKRQCILPQILSLCSFGNTYQSCMTFQ